MTAVRMALVELGRMRTAVFLLALAALASLLGTLVPQGLPLEDYVARWGVMGGQVLWYAGLTEVFRAPWFLGIMATLVGSVAVCVARNGPGMARQMLRARELRRRVHRLGYFCVHLGVLGVALSGLVTGFVGWRGTMNVREGESDHVALVWHGRQAVGQALPFKLVNEAFEMEQYPSGMPRRFASRVRVEGCAVTNCVPGAFTVEVNRPLRVGGYRVYQASFGDGGSVVRGQGLDVRGGTRAAFAARVYEEAKLADGARVEILDFRPFTVETLPGKKPMDVGPSVDYVVQPPDAPAVQLRAYLNHPDVVGLAESGVEGKAVYRPVWVGLSTAEEWALVARLVKGEEMKRVLAPALKSLPEQERLEKGLALVNAAKMVEALGLTHVLLLEDFELRRYSGFQVVYDPAATFFWLSALVLMVGVVMMVGGRKEGASGGLEVGGRKVQNGKKGR